MCSGVVWRRFLGAAAWPFGPRPLMLYQTSQKIDNKLGTHEDRLVRHVTTAAERDGMC